MDGSIDVNIPRRCLCYWRLDYGENIDMNVDLVLLGVGAIAIIGFAIYSSRKKD